jgi:hypothetical protein
LMRSGSVNFDPKQMLERFYAMSAITLELSIWEDVFSDSRGG